jgi:hypothetical protein
MSAHLFSNERPFENFRLSKKLLMLKRLFKNASPFFANAAALTR